MRILILDDDAPFAHMLRGQLERLEPTFTAEAVATTEAARAAVRDTTDPFDVFLLDQRLDGPDVDGITLMVELKLASPTSDAIILTGYDDQEAGIGAFSAGAYRYLTKPFDTRELISILKVLQNDRKTRRERDWLHILIEITSEMQGTDDSPTLAIIIVRGALRFGFRRARLRLFEQDGREAVGDPEMVGISQVGSPELTGFEGLKTPLSKLVYSQRALASGQPVVFHGRDLGPGGNDDFFTVRGIPLPKGDWFKIPLFSGGQPVGALTLDNGDEERTFSQQQRSQLTQALDLFGTQAAAALERARLHEQARRQAEQAEVAAQEARALSGIGRQVTTKAATGDLETLLDEVRDQVKGLMDAANFMVVLSDLETGVLDFRRQYEEATGDGKPEDRHWRATNIGLSGYVIAHDHAVLTDDTESFRKRHGIIRQGPPAQCWLGVPLRVDGQAKGALVVQSYHDKLAYTEHHQHLLSLVADHVAGAIHLAHQLERKEELKHQTEALEALKPVLPDLIKESEDVFWHAVLTTITHKQGNSFNRAALFWFSEDGERLVGRMAIGHLSDQDARKAWERDRDAGHSLVQYFKAPHRVMLNPTPLQKLVVGQHWPVGVDGGACRRVRTHGERLVCQSDELRDCLPNEILSPSDLQDEAKSYACALLPVKSATGVLGLLMVDNAFDGEPLRGDDLESLERVLTAAMEVWQQSQETSRTRRLGERYEAALTLQRQVTAQAGNRPLKETLQDLCQGAMGLSDADAVVIYPFQASSGRYDFDLVSHVGLEYEQAFLTRNKPRQQGVTFTVLQSGTLVVPDVSRALLSFAGRRLAEHEFLRREKVEALIAAPLRHAVTSEPLGVIYLDYRSRQKFTDQEVALAEHLAAIGAIAISYRREMKRESLDRAVAEHNEQQLLRIMQLLNNVQTQALTSDTDQEKMVRAILLNATELFDRAVDPTLALLEWEGEGEQRKEVRRDYHLTPQGRLGSKRIERSHGLIGQALQESTPYAERNTISCAIRRGVQPVGAILLKKRGRNLSFTPAEVEVAERLATVAALALDNTRARAHLEELSRTIGAVVDPSGLQETLEKVVDSARKVAPDIDCITLWYRDAETGELISGPQRDVTTERHKGSNASTNRIVQRVMKRRKPLFAPVVEREPALWSDFVMHEGIVSAAAFPLRFGVDRRVFGALFFNYRKAHEFPASERTLFETFANAAATAIHSVQTIELAERRRRRLETALKVATQAGASLERDEVLRGVLTVLRSEFRRNSADGTVPYIMLYDDRNRILELPEVAREFYQPDGSEYRDRVRLQLGTEGKEGKREKRGITVQVAQRARDEKRIVVKNVPDVSRDPDYVEVSASTRSEMCAGLVSEGRLLGALVMKSNRLAAFNQEDEKLFETAAYQVAIAIDRVEAAKRHVSDVKRLTVLAWRSEIAHQVRQSLTALSSIRHWFENYLNNTSNPAPGTSKCHSLISASLSEFNEMLNTDLSTSRSWKLSELMEEMQSWVESKKNDTKEWRFISFEWPVLNQDVTISCDPRLLCRSLQNIITNSAEAIKESGNIGLYVLQTSDNAGEIVIWDNGTGFPEEMYSRVGQEDWSTKGKNRGFGLFNATVFLETMGGSLELLRPTPDSSSAGARVVVRVPLAKTLIE